MNKEQLELLLELKKQHLKMLRTLIAVKNAQAIAKSKPTEAQE
jgi:hypothetical protein